MKKIFTLISAALLVAGVADAQQQSRLVRVGNMRDNGNGMLPVDSSHVKYKDNSRGIDGTEYQYIQYLEGKNSCDTIEGLAYMSGSWVTGMKFEMTYDANGRISVHHMLRPSGAGTRVSYQKVTFTYDASGNITKELREQWNTTTNAWENYSQKLNEYTANNLAKQTRQMWHNSAWANDQVAEYTYNNGLKQDYFFTSWNYMTGNLMNKSKTVYSYNGSGHFTQMLTQDYDANTATYKDKYREVHTVNAKGNILLTETANWNATGGVWDAYSKLAYTYDSKDRNVRDTFETWDAVNSKWKPSLTYEYTYDDSGSEIDFVLALWDTDSVKYIDDQRIMNDRNTLSQLTRYHTYRWNRTTMSWEQKPGDYDNKYYYELYTPAPGSVSAQQLANGLKLYPVPAGNVLTVKLAAAMHHDFTVSITDLRGSVITSWKEKAVHGYTKQIPLHGMANGNYLLTINDGTQSITKQFVVVNQ